MSRRLVLSTAALVIGLSSCGTANTTTNGATAGSTSGTIAGTAAAGTAAADGTGTTPPAVIKLLRPGVAPAAGSPISADSKMMAFGNVTYTFDGTMPTLSDSGASWQFPAGYEPDPARVALMAAALGITDEPRQLPADQGGGWMVGPVDYTAATLTVSDDGLGTWWFSPAPSTNPSISSSCGYATPDTISTPGAETGDVVDVASTAVPLCEAPTPPVGVPGRDDSIAKTKQLLTDLGFAAGSFEYEYFGDEWNASVTAYPVLDGLRDPLSMNAGFGAEGALLWASGSLAGPVRAADYPLAGVQAGIDRLNDSQGQWMSYGMGYTRGGVRIEGAAASAVATTAGVTEGAVDTPEGSGAVSDAALPPITAGPPTESIVAPEPMPCGDATTNAATDCAPIDTTPITIHLTSVKPDLTLIWDVDGVPLLLPAYGFTDIDDATYSVIAVADAFLDVSTPAIDPTQDTVLVSSVPPDPAPEPPTTGPVDTVSVVPAPDQTPPHQISVDPAAAAAALVGLTEDDATATARANGWTMRVAQRDGIDLAVTADYSTSRVNVAVTNGVVTGVQSIG